MSPRRPMGPASSKGVPATRTRRRQLGELSPGVDLGLRRPVRPQQDRSNLPQEPTARRPAAGPRPLQAPPPAPVPAEADRGAGIPGNPRGGPMRDRHRRHRTPSPVRGHARSRGRGPSTAPASATARPRRSSGTRSCRGEGDSRSAASCQGREPVEVTSWCSTGSTTSTRGPATTRASRTGSWSSRCPRSAAHSRRDAGDREHATREPSRQAAWPRPCSETAA